MCKNKVTDFLRSSARSSCFITLKRTTPWEPYSRRWAALAVMFREILFWRRTFRASMGDLAASSGDNRDGNSLAIFKYIRTNGRTTFQHTERVKTNEQWAVSELTFVFRGSDMLSKSKTISSIFSLTRFIHWCDFPQSFPREETGRLFFW